MLLLYCDVLRAARPARDVKHCKQHRGVVVFLQTITIKNCFAAWCLTLRYCELYMKLRSCRCLVKKHLTNLTQRGDTGGTHLQC